MSEDDIKSRIEAQKATVRELELKLKKEREERPLPEPTGIPKDIIAFLQKFAYTKFLVQPYLKHYDDVNYAIVAGLGVLFNTVIQLLLMNLGMQFWMTNPITILIVWRWNYTFSVGPLGHIFGFRNQKKKETSGWQ